MEVNDGFCAMAVRAREDVLGHSAVGLWADPAERARVIEQLRQHGSVDGLECRFVRSTGETFTGLFSAGLMKRGDVDWCLSAIHDISARKALEVSREELIAQLQASLADVKTLSGIVPICMYCKNVRDDQGFWNRVEAFVQSRTAAQFSHSLCPDCERLHFPAK